MISKFGKLFFLIFIANLFLSKIESLENAKNPQITTNDYGEYAYAIWLKNDGTNDIVQAANSSDSGNNWSNPLSLSQSGQNAYNPLITDNTFQAYIYTIWSRSNGTNDIIQYDASQNYGSLWSIPVNLSDANQTASTPDLAIDKLGKKIYITWVRSNGTNNIIQFIKSTDFGNIWSNVINLSNDNQNAQDPKIVTSHSRNCICAIWQRSNGVNDIIQFKHSSNAGDSWDSVVDLSENGQNAKSPQILSKVFSIIATWVRSNGTNDIVQCKNSTDNTMTWSNAINLSTAGQNAKDPQISSDYSGRFAYITWLRSDGVNDIVQITSSDLYGNTWNSPIDLSNAGQNAKNPQITTNQDGQYVYVVWTRSNGVNDIIELSTSTNTGKTWSPPIALSQSGQNAKNPQIITDVIGMHVYAIWARSDGVEDVIQASSSNSFGTSWSTPITISN